MILPIASTLYKVDLDIPYVIPMVYVVSLLVCVLIRDFTHGWLRYVLACLFLASFCTLWFMLMFDDSLWRLVVPAVILFGGAAGLWGWLRSALRDLKKI